MNNEGCYILEVRINYIGNGKKMCFDATRTIYSYGRLINHATKKWPTSSHIGPCSSIKPGESGSMPCVTSRQEKNSFMTMGQDI